MYVDVSYRSGSAEFPHDNPAFDRCTLWVGSALCTVEGETPGPAPAALQEASETPKAPLATLWLDVNDVLQDVLQAVAAAEPGAAVLDEVPGNETPKAPLAALWLDPNDVLQSPAKEQMAAEAAESMALFETPAAEPQDPTDEPEMPETDGFTIFVRAVSEVALAHGSPEAAAHARYLLVSGCPAPCPLTAESQQSLVEGKILRSGGESLAAAEAFSELADVWQRVLRGEESDLARCGESTLDGWAAELVARVVASPGKASSIRRDLRRRGVAAFGMLESLH